MAELRAGPPLVLAGAAAPPGDLPPVVGVRRCRISHPLAALPTMRGPWGRAWRVDLAAARRGLPLGAPPDAMLDHWIVEAPWSSEVVHSYSLILTHLRFDMRYAPVTRYLEGATHEVALIAVHPQVDRGAMLAAPTDMSSWLRPAVFGAQIIAADDASARARLIHAVELICSGALSPHPAHAGAWCQLLGDNMMRVAQAALPQE